MIVYVLHSAIKRRVKIGLTDVLERRMRQLQAEHGPLDLVHTFGPFDSRTDLFAAEAALHWHYRRSRVVDEWFAEDVLATVRTLDVAAVLAAYKRTRVYEVRLSRADVEALKARGLDIEDCVVSALAHRNTSTIPSG